MLTDSQFAMWRTVFAIAHADGVVTAEEKQFMTDMLVELDLSDEQIAILKSDIEYAQDIAEMYKQITDDKDRMKFFEFAKTMVWIDGDYGADEQAVIAQLQRLQVMETNVDDLVGNVDLQLEDGPGGDDMNIPPSEKPKTTIRDMMYSFRDRFKDSLDE